jgi:hypothetical protein
VPGTLFAMIFHSIYFSAAGIRFIKNRTHRPMMKHYTGCKPPSGKNFMPKSGIFAKSGKILAISKVVCLLQTTRV